MEHLKAGEVRLGVRGKLGENPLMFLLLGGLEHVLWISMGNIWKYYDILSGWRFGTCSMGNFMIIMTWEI